MAEIASAWVSLLPSAKGFGAATASAIGPQMGVAGKSAGGILGKAIGVAAGGALLAAGIGKALYSIGETFDDMSDTIAVGTGASGEALTGLENVAKKIGKTTPSAFADIGTAVAGLNQRLDLTGAPLRNMATKVLNLSRITGTDLNGNIADLSRVFGDWGISMKDQPAALDKIFFASQATGTSINDLAQSVVQMGAPLRQFGFSFEESLAMFGKWEKEGVNTTAVMSGLKIGLGKFSKAGEDPQRALAQVEKAIMGAGSAGEANAIAIEAFGQRAGPDMAAAVREGRFALGDLVKGIQGSSGSIEKADKGTRDFAETWQVFKNNVLLTLEPIATRVFGQFSDFAAGALPKLAKGFQKFADEMKSGRGAGGEFVAKLKQIGDTAKSIGGFLLRNRDVLVRLAAALVVAKVAVVGFKVAMATYAVVQGVVNGVAAAAAGILAAYNAVLALSNSYLAVWVGVKAIEFAAWTRNAAATVAATAVTLAASAATKVAAAGQWLLNAALTANPIGLIVVAIAALVAGLILAYRHSETFRAVVDAVFSFLKTALSATISFIADHWQLIVSIIGGPLVAIGILVVQHWGAIKDFVTSAVSAVIDFVKSHWRTIITIIGGPLGLAVALVTKHWNTIKSVTSAAWNAIKAVISSAWGAIKSVVSAGVNAVRGYFNLIATIVGKVRGWFGDILSVIKTKLGEAVAFVKGVPGKMIAAFTGMAGRFYDAGAKLISMLAQGIRDKAEDAIGALKDVAGKLAGMVPGSPVKEGPLKSFNGGAAGKKLMEMLAGGIKSAGPKVLKEMQDAVEKALDRIDSLRDGVASRLDGIKSAFSSLKDSIASTFTGNLFNVSAIAESLTDTTFTAAQSVGQVFVDGLRDKKGELTGLLRAFKKLKKWGIPAQFLSQLFASGNTGLILELASGTRSQAAATTSLFGDVQSLSNQLGGQVARNQYGDQINRLDKKLERIEDHTRELKHLAKDIGRELNNAVSHGQKKAS